MYLNFNNAKVIKIEIPGTISQYKNIKIVTKRRLWVKMSGTIFKYVTWIIKRFAK